MPVTFRPFRPHPRPGSIQAFPPFTIQHWQLSLAAGNSIPLGAPLSTRRLAQHGTAVSGSSSYGLAVHLRCSSRWNRSNAVPLVTGDELLPEADSHRPGHATRRRTRAAVPSRIRLERDRGGWLARRAPVCWAAAG